LEDQERLVRDARSVAIRFALVMRLGRRERGRNERNKNCSYIQSKPCPAAVHAWTATGEHLPLLELSGGGQSSSRRPGQPVLDDERDSSGRMAKMGGARVVGSAAVPTRDCRWPGVVLPGMDALSGLRRRTHWARRPRVSAD